MATGMCRGIYWLRRMRNWRANLRVLMMSLRWRLVSSNDVEWVTIKGVSIKNTGQIGTFRLARSIPVNPTLRCKSIRCYKTYQPCLFERKSLIIGHLGNSPYSQAFYEIVVSSHCVNRIEEGSDLLSVAHSCAKLGPEAKQSWNALAVAGSGPTSPADSFIFFQIDIISRKKTKSIVRSCSSILRPNAGILSQLYWPAHC